MTRQSTRRKFLASGAVVTGVALAGCAGDPEPEDEPSADDGDDEPIDGDEPTVEADTAVEVVYSKEQLRTNCGTIAHPDEEKFYLTAGAPSNREPEGVGEWYVLDAESHLPLDPDSGETVEEFETLDVARDLDGYDTHGFWFVENDGELELWLLNRETDDGVVIDPETDEVIDEIDDYGPAPDIMWSSPDDEYMFVTLRGPEPVSGDPHAAEGETPGVSVLDVETREIVTTLEPDADNPDSDFHGIGVVPHDDDGYEIWALDQGTDIIYIYEPVEDEDDEFEVVDEINLHETEGTIEASNYVPHMADFSSEYDYAAIACTAGGQTLVFDVEARELVEAIETGPSSHFAGFTPDDEQIIVDVIGGEEGGYIQQVLVDLDEEEFELGESIDILETAEVVDHDDDIESANPICHDHAGDYSYHTLGPSVDDSGLVVLNWAEFGESDE